MNTVRKILVLFVALLAGIFASAAETHADSILASSCSASDVSNAIVSASAGDTVTVPSGTCTWSSGLSLTKHISLIGGYGGTTTITGSITIDPTIDASNLLLRVSNFTFNGGGATIMMFGTWSKSYSPGFDMMTNIRIDHIKFQNFYPGLAIWNTGTFYGVVDNNQFGTPANPCGYCMWFQPNGSDAQAHNYFGISPQNIFEPGSEKFIYFEDNIFYVGLDISRVVVHQYGSRGAYRYNTIYAPSTDGLFELHGHQGGMPATFGTEIYGNRVEGSNSGFFRARSGKSFAYYNSVNNAVPDFNSYWGSMNTCPTLAPYLQIEHDSYFWNNRSGYTGATQTWSNSGGVQGACAGLSNIPQAGRDFFTDSTTPGVTSGLLANRPASCSIGQGYWATNQSTTDLTGFVGDINTYPSRQSIVGTLYKCTALNTWTSFYQPYTYPHPLTTGSSPSTQILPPTNVQIIQ